MEGFDVCVSCSRHVKRAEPACPFCRAPHVPAARAPRPAQRVSRAAWLATTLASGLAVAACAGAVEPSSTDVDAGRHDAGGRSASADAGERPDGRASNGDDAQAAYEPDARTPDAEAPDVGPPDTGEPDTGWHTCYGAPPARLERGLVTPRAS